MIVRIRFGRGTTVARRRGKNSRWARLGASLLTIVSISCASLGVWRLGQDLDWFGNFVFTEGLLSHWIVWLAAAGLSQYAAWKLARYAESAVAPETESEPDHAEHEVSRAV
jgi:hypothetical protein